MTTTRTLCLVKGQPKKIRRHKQLGLYDEYGAPPGRHHQRHSRLLGTLYGVHRNHDVQRGSPLLHLPQVLVPAVQAHRPLPTNVPGMLVTLLPVLLHGRPKGDDSLGERFFVEERFRGVFNRHHPMQPPPPLHPEGRMDSLRIRRTQ